MLKTLIAFFALVFFTNSNAFFWDAKIIEVSCIGDNNGILILYKYEFKDKEIYETMIEPKQKILLSLTKLEDCVIKDTKNWVCGGKSTSSVAPITYKIDHYSTERHAVLEGRYQYNPSTSNFIVQKDTWCKKRLQTN